MKVAVCVKHVPEPAARRLDPSTKRLDRSGEGALNPFDMNAVEEALRYMARYPEVRMVSFRQLVDWLDAQPPGRLRQLYDGRDAAPPGRSR